MNDSVRLELREMAIAYGPQLWADARLCRSLLRDAFPAAQSEVNVLLAALDQGVPHELSSKAHRVEQFPVPTELIRRLVENLAMDETAARWAVAGWSAAVGAVEIAADVPRRLQTAEDDAAVVSPGGEGHFRSINEALQSDPAPSRLILRPGVYRESVELSHDIEIVALGRQEEVVLETPAGSCIKVWSGKVCLRGLTLRARRETGTANVLGGALEVFNGEVLAEDCDISGGRDCVLIHGSGHLRRCRVHEGKSSGIEVYGEGAATVEDCEVFGNGCGIQVRKRAKCNTKNCCVRNNSGSGIYTSELSETAVDDCVLTDGISSSGGRLAVRRCKIHGVGWPGVFLNGDIDAIIEDCHISSCKEQGVGVMHGCSVAMSRCTVTDCEGFGFAIRVKKAALKAEDCTICSNNMGVSVEEGAKAEVLRCHILDNRGAVAVHIWGAGVVRIDSSTILRNRGCGVSVGLSDGYVISNCRISENRCGIALHRPLSRGTVEHCDLRGNRDRAYEGLLWAWDHMAGHVAWRGNKV